MRKSPPKPAIARPESSANQPGIPSRASYPYLLLLERSAPYLAAAFLSLGILCWVTELWRADFKVLFTYYYGGGDLFWNAANIKGLLETGSYFTNPSLGAPFGYQDYDFPVSEALHVFLLRVLNVFTRNCAETINLLYVLSFPMTALSAVWVFLRLKIGALPAVLCSLFYTFLYYHFSRGMMHFALACYYLVPLIFWVAITVGDSEAGQAPAGLKEMLKSRWFLGRLAICAAMASYGFYYSFFSMFFLACAGVYAWFVRRSRQGLLASFLLASAMLVTSFCNVIPNLIFWAHEGKNTVAVVREASSSEFYGLKIMHLLLPVPGHRIALLAAFNRTYWGAVGGSEASSASFGFIGALGFVLLLAYALFRRRDSIEDRPLELVATLNLSGFLLATVGGFGALLAFLGFTHIRGYNRMSVFLAFPAFLAIGLIWRKIERAVPLRRRPLFVAISLLAGLLGLWDEIPAAVAPNYALSQRESQHDASYTATLESSVPTGSMIFQLPYIYFPEHGPMLAMGDYSHYRCYLYSKHLRWSYGVVRGRKGAQWMEAISALPAPQMVKAVADAGYAGIYIDRFGYADRAVALESQLEGLLGTTPLVSGDNRLSFFNLGVTASWAGEFGTLEHDARESWRWCGNSGVLRLTNRSNHTEWVRLEATLTTSWPEQDKVDIKGPAFADEVSTTSHGLDWERVMPVPPGEQQLVFSSEGRKNAVSGRGDARNLVFALRNFSLTPLPAPAADLARKALVRPPIDVVWGPGAYPEETGPNQDWHWCSANCEIAMLNPSSQAIRVRMKMNISGTNPKKSQFTVKSSGLFDAVPVDNATYPLAYTVDLAPGKNVVSLSCDSIAIHPNGDPRNLVFMVHHFTIERAEAERR